MPVVLYLTINWGVFVSVFLFVCVCVCVFVRLNVSEFLKIGGNTYHGLLIVWYMQRARVRAKRARAKRARAKRARMCAFAYFLTDSLQIFWEHTTTHHQ
jgi:hypothetical protein